MRNVLLVVALAAIGGCTDAGCAGVASLGSAGRITCYSGGKVTYDGTSTGKIETVTNSDGWEFKDAASGRFVRVSGDCVIVN